MTPEDLTRLVAHGSTGELAAALAPLTEAERKKLAPTVVAIRKELSRRETARNRGLRAGTNLLVTPPGPCPYCGKTLRTATAQQCNECGKTWHDTKKEGPAIDAVATAHFATAAGQARLRLALLALGPWTEAQRIRVWHVAPSHVPDLRDYLFHVLRMRKPEWLPKWVDKELAEQFADWQFVRQLVRAGLCPKPTGDNYTLRMLRGIYSFDAKNSLKDRLEADPELLTDEIWRIFELSPARETILDSMDATQLIDNPDIAKDGRHRFLWSGALRDLAAEGKLDRQRLLAACLGSLLRNTEARNTAWFHKFHELLGPTEDERQALQPSYLQLLSHPVPSVVGMALDALSILEKAQKLDAPAFVDAVAPVFHLQPKAQPLAAVKLLGRVNARCPVLGPRIAELLLAGTTNAATAVQEAIIALLPKLHDRAADVIASMLPGQLGGLTPSVQADARKLLAEDVAAVPSHDSALDDLIADARQVPSPWRELAGIDSILQAIDNGGPLTAVNFDSMAVPRLDQQQQVQPIATLDELIERLTIAAEKLDDPIEFEILLDGLSRLCDQRPDDFGARVAALVHRIQKAMPTQLAIPHGLQSYLLPLVLHWCDQPFCQARQDRDTILGILELRIGVLAMRIRNRQAAPLLACPTHRRGWIDPCEMVNRLRWLQDHGLETTTHDVIQGLLRLAPDGRVEALADAASLQGKFAPALRYALGGRLEESQLSPPVLIAAGRAHAAATELVELHGIGAALGPDAVHPARYSWEFVQVGKGTPHEGARLQVHVEPAQPAFEKMRDLPSVLLHTWRVSEVLNRWVGTVWPANMNPFFAVGARLRQQDYFQVMIDRQRADFLEPLFDPNVPFSEPAQLVVAAALSQAEPEVTGLAVDLLIELIRDGRCVGPELGRMFASMVAACAIKLNRLGKHLETVSRASQLHVHVCAQIVLTACTGLADIPRDFHCLLSPLLEWLTALDENVGADFRLVLEKAKSGKSAALAKRLSNLSFTSHGHKLFFADALDGRLQRAKGWVSSKHKNP